MMIIKTLIVDDEIMARKVLEKYCNSNPNIVLIGSASDGKEALQMINDHELDLVLLDVEMPELTGIELLDKLPYFPQIVFTTSKRDYALEAFEYDVTDYLMKPIALSRFSVAIEKVINRINQLGTIAEHSSSQELYVKVDSKYIRVPYENVLYFENAGDYISVKTTMGNYIIYGALKALDTKLKYPGFLKVHRSYIVNLDKIVDIQDSTLVIEKKVIPISRAHKPILLRSINLIN
jgi:DNA-binding LytR/AlgR family response regulator